MHKKECKRLFRIIDPIDDSSQPLRAEYFRGYHRGMEAQVFGISDEWIEDHCMLVDYSIGGSGDAYIDSYARGYHDGFVGLAPESTSISSGRAPSVSEGYSVS